MSSLIAGTMCGTLDDMEFEQKLLYFESHNPFVPMFPAYLQISPYLQIYRSVSPDLQICIVTTSLSGLVCPSRTGTREELFRLWSRVFHDYESLRRTLRTVIRMITSRVGVWERSPTSPALTVLWGSQLTTPTMQSVQETWKGPGTRHASGVWVFN